MTGSPAQEFGGVFEVAELLGVSRTYVSGKVRYMPGFPEVFQRLRSGPVWDMAAIREWADEHWWPTHTHPKAEALGQPIGTTEMTP